MTYLKYCIFILVKIQLIERSFKLSTVSSIYRKSFSPFIQKQFAFQKHLFWMKK